MLMFNESCFIISIGDGTSNVTTMEFMFGTTGNFSLSDAMDFNQDIGDWDVGKVQILGQCLGIVFLIKIYPTGTFQVLQLGSNV